MSEQDYERGFRMAMRRIMSEAASELMRDPEALSEARAAAYAAELHGMPDCRRNSHA